MKIGIDARWIFPEISGVGAYTVELLRALARCDRENEYLAVFHREDLRERTVAQLGPALAGAAMQTVCVPWPVFSPMGQLAMPGWLRRQGVEVWHSTNYMIPLPAFSRAGSRPGRIKAVVTIHDVIPMLFPGHAPRSRKSRVFPLYCALMREIGRRAAAILSDTDTSRADVQRCLGIPEREAGRLHTIPCGVSERFHPPAEPPVGGRGAGGTVLYVGRADPYKNLVGLVEAFARVRAALPGPLELVIAGPRDARYPEAAERAAALGLGDTVRWTGYLSEAALVNRYQSAAVLVLPSRYEGFGLPVLEAMACGTPVVCSDIGALREVAGEAALRVPPEDVSGLADAIRRVLTEPELAGSLRQKGLARAAQFSWDETARRTMAVYRQVGGAAEGGTR